MSLVEYAKKRKLRVNVGKSKVMRCLRYGNGGRMHVILNGEPLEYVDCFGNLGRKWQLMEDVLHIMNAGYRAWAALKREPS